MKQIIAKVFTFLLIFSFMTSPVVAQMMSFDADQSTLDEPETAYMQVVHLAPFAEDASVTITLNGEPALNDFSYGDSTEYIELLVGEYEIAVIPTGADPADPPAIAATVDLAADTFYTVLAVGDGVNQDLDLRVLVDDLSEPAAGKFHLRLGHLAPFAEDALADVRLKDGTLLFEVDFSDETGFIPYDAGTYDLVITTPGGDTILIDPAPVTFAEGEIISAFAAGEGVNQGLGVFALPAGEEGFFLPMTAYVQVVHLAPFAEDASVTITLNGEPALTDFDYGDSTAYIELLWGEYEIAVLPTGADPADPPAIAATVDLAVDTYYTVLAVGDGVNQDLDLIVLEDDLSEPEAGKFHLRLGHLAPFAAGPATADVRLKDGTPVLEDVDFGDVTGFITLDAGEYDLVITTPGGDTVLIDPAPVTFAEGDIISAFVAGEGVNQDLGVFALPAGEEGFFLPMSAYVQVVHLAPFAEDASVTITLNGEPALTDFDYGDSTAYIELLWGEYEIAVLPTGADPADPPAIEVTVDLAADTYYTVLAVGDGVNQNLDLIVLVDDLSEPEAGKFHLRLGHLAPFAEDALADVRLKDGTLLFEVDFSDETGFIPYDAGTYDLVITTPGGGTVLIDPAPVTFAEGDIISAFVAGEGVNQDLGVFALPAGEEGFFLPLVEEPVIFNNFLPLIFKYAYVVEEYAYVQVAHLAPFAEGASVTITLNGEPALTNFEYGDSTEYIELPVGDYDIAVIPTGGTDPAIEATVDLAADTYYTVLAVGDGVNQELDLIVLEDDLSEPAAGKFHLRLGHLAPFAAGPATADVRLKDGTPVLENVDFSDVTGYIPLDAGTYDLVITTPGGGTVLIDPAPVTFAEGEILSAFAAGEGMNQDLGVFALPAGEEGFFLPLAEPEVFTYFFPLFYNYSYAYVQVAHLAPFAEDASVTITLNGEPALTDFSYGDSTVYIKLLVGEYDIAVIPTGADPADPPAIEATVELEADTYYIVLAVGDGVNLPLALKVLEDDNTAPAEGNFKLRLGHLAPFADTLADTAADVRLADNTLILGNIEFGNVADSYMQLPAGTYDLVITTPGGGTVLIDPAPVTFVAGQIISAFAAGEGENQDLGVFALPSGVEGFFLPLAE